MLGPQHEADMLRQKLFDPIFDGYNTVAPVPNLVEAVSYDPTVLQKHVNSLYSTSNIQLVVWPVLFGITTEWFLYEFYPEVSSYILTILAVILGLVLGFFIRTRLRVKAQLIVCQALILRNVSFSAKKIVEEKLVQIAEQEREE